MKGWKHSRPLVTRCTSSADFLAGRSACSIHTSISRGATPFPSVSPGPPPKPPVPAATTPEDRIERKRRNAELLKIGQNLRAEASGKPSKPGTAALKRFWKDVSVKQTEDGLQIMLDVRPVRTPSRQILILPHSKPHLATAIALEWDSLISAQQAVKNTYIPMTSLSARALDIKAADEASNPTIRQNIVKMVMRYLTTDTLLCWAPEKNRHDAESNVEKSDRGTTLRDLQMKTAAPILNVLTSRIWPGVEILPSLNEESITPTPQPEMTTQVITGWVSGLSAYDLAALERGVLASKSLLIAARLLVEWSYEFTDVWKGEQERERFTIEDAAEACNLETAWQTRMWGEVEDTHDVNREDLRRQLGSVILLVQGAP